MTRDNRPAIAQVDSQIRWVLDDAAFAAAHPTSTHHLNHAFKLLATHQLDQETVVEIGDHLRDALIDSIADVLGSGSPADERPIERLRDHLATLRLPVREAKLVAQVVELARVSLRLDHRLSHIDEETDDYGGPHPQWSELRHAAFGTAFACYELDRLANG
jgi:hypothetical protein